MKTTKILFGVLTLTCSLTVCGYSQSFLTNGLVAYYPFDGNANDVVAANNGTVSGATLTTDRFGQNNGAYYFNGSSLIEAANQGLPLGNTSRTFSLWVKVASNGGYAIPLRYGGDSTGAGNWMNIFTDSDGTGRPVWSVLFDFYNSSLLSTNLIGSNTWQHLVCSLTSPSTARIYINGTPAGTGPVFANTTSARTLLIGGSHNCCGVVGSVDDVRVYNRALSDSEVQQLYVVESGPRLDLIKAVKPSFSNLNLSTNYQLQVSSDMSTWTNQGSPFTATNRTMVSPQYWDVENWNSLFFRLQAVP